MQVARLGPTGPSRLRYGVPAGGPWDAESADLAKALVGATECHELLFRARVTLEALADVSLAVVGTTTRVQIGSLVAGGNSCRRVRKGVQVVVETLRPGAAYVAWGPPRQEGVLESGPSSSREEPISVLPGPQRGQMEVPTSLTCTVGDRVGLRLAGWSAPHAVELASEPSCFGAVQVTPSGQLLVSGPEGPTLGGYPKGWVVTQASRGRLIQSVSHSFTFREVGLDEAEREYEAFQRAHRQRLALLALGVGSR